MPADERQIRRVGCPKVTAASALAAAAIAWLANPFGGTDLIPALLIRGVGQGLLMTPLLNAVLSRVDESRAGAASGVLSTMQQVGGALGVAVVSVLFFGTMEQARAGGVALAVSYADGFIAASLYGAAGLALTALCIALLPNGKRCSRAAERSGVIRQSGEAVIRG